jgi:hypothetical protein
MKRCSKCETNKVLEEFHKNSRRKDGRQPYCKECSKSYYKTWQNQKPETRRRHADWKAERVAESRNRIVEYLQDHACVDCNESDIRVLVFDHVRGIKVAGVAALVNRGAKWELIEEEISKCEVRCANHHAIVTAQRGGFWTMAV